MKLLSILICTLESRKKTFDLLMGNLNAQLKKKDFYEKVEVLFDKALEITIGEKRNNLLDKSSGKFIVFIDDDDDVMDYYIEQIVQTIEEHPLIDCIGINGIITFAGANERKWYISKDYGRWYESANEYFRTPNHISPIKREIAMLVKFPLLNNSEDFIYSMGVLPYLKHEIKITHPMYHYKFSTPIPPSVTDSDGSPYRKPFR